MTALDKQLAQTFRAARWAESDGTPVCPDCFDGEDLGTPTPDPLTPGLSRYRCSACRVAFSDVKGTVLVTRKPVPLALWAYLVLLGDPRQLRWRQDEVQRCGELALRIKIAPLVLVWREQLRQAGVTVERVRRALARLPEAA